MFKKYFRLIALSVLFVLTVTGCGKKTDHELGRYYNKQKGFSIKLPSGWELKQEYLKTTVAAFSPKDNAEDKFRENVNVLVEDLSSVLSVREYYEMNLTKMHQHIKDFQEINSGQTTINNEPAMWLIYAHKMGPTEVKAKVYYLVKGQRAYSITGAAVPELFDKYKPIFEMSVMSFKFE